MNCYGIGMNDLIDATAYYWQTKQQPEKNMKKLFWVAVLYHGGKNRKKTEVVQFPEVNLFVSEDAAREETIAGIPASYKKRYDRLEVLVRPF